MSRPVMCFHPDRERQRQLTDLIREIGEETVEPVPGHTVRLARSAATVVAGGDEGADLLARLALDCPALPRIVVVDSGISREALLGVIERCRPWAAIPEPLEALRLHAVLRDALASVSKSAISAEHTDRVRQPPPILDFEQLVHDRLTGTEGYYYLRLQLEKELERASRYGRPLSLALVDLDDLRGINDRFGRAVGDFALQQVAATLTAGARAVDRVGRWAGGTFALVLPETGAKAAYDLSERLRGKVAARRLAAPVGSGRRQPPRLRITVSCGVASTLREGVSRPASLLQRSDAALWRAKQGGRNRSVADG